MPWNDKSGYIETVYSTNTIYGISTLCSIFDGYVLNGREGMLYSRDGNLKLIEWLNWTCMCGATRANNDDY